MKAEYVDHMGDDARVANAARVSFNKEVTEFGEKDAKLIRYLARHQHWTPFGHCGITLRETVPIFVARQRFKHTVGFVYNEVSRRYVDDDPEFFTPSSWRGRPEGSVKQGSSQQEVVELVHGEMETVPILLMDVYPEFLEHALCLYKDMIASGVAPEQARMVLPQSMYTSYYVTGSLSAFARAYNLRSDPHAQLEIQELASQWDEIISPLFPVSWAALCGDSEAVTKELTHKQV